MSPSRFRFGKQQQLSDLRRKLRSPARTNASARVTHMGSGMSVIRLNATLICSAHGRRKPHETCSSGTRDPRRPLEQWRLDHWSALKLEEQISGPQDPGTHALIFHRKRVREGVSAFARWPIGSVMKFGAKPSYKIKAPRSTHNPQRHQGHLGQMSEFCLSFCYQFRAWLWSTMWDRVIIG